MSTASSMKWYERIESNGKYYGDLNLWLSKMHPSKKVREWG